MWKILPQINSIRADLIYQIFMRQNEGQLDIWFNSKLFPTAQKAQEFTANKFCLGYISSKSRTFENLTS